MFTKAGLEGLPRPTRPARAITRDRSIVRSASPASLPLHGIFTSQKSMNHPIVGSICHAEHKNSTILQPQAAVKGRWVKSSDSQRSYQSPSQCSLQCKRIVTACEGKEEALTVREHYHLEGHHYCVQTLGRLPVRAFSLLYQLSSGVRPFRLKGQGSFVFTELRCRQNLE